MAGLSYTLTCYIMGIDNLDPNITYLWTRNSIQISANSSTGMLYFPSLRLSDAGVYTCQVAVRSPYLRNEITARTYYSLILERKLSIQIVYPTTYCAHLITVPAPASIKLTSNKPNPIRPVGSDITVTCTIILSPAVDVPVTVNINLSDPAGRTLTTTTPAVSGSTHTTTAMISSFGRNQSGIYTCEVNTSTTLTPSFITDGKTRFETFRITAGELIALNDKYNTSIDFPSTGVYLSLKGVVYANNSFVTVTEIGEGDDSLKCMTDHLHCCHDVRLGEWYFPNGSMVPIPYTATSFYRLRSGGYVYLNRLNSNITHPVGKFCCVLPDTTDIYQTLCVNLSKYANKMHKPLHIKFCPLHNLF